MCIRDRVKAAAGLSEERGDMLIVESLPFNREMQEEEKKALASQNMMRWIELLAKYGLIALLIFLMYSLGRRIPVSYTHLDVYKRQAQEGLPARGAGFEIFDKNTFGLTSFLQKVNYQRALQGELERTIMAVSYTHLDVYKRQDSVYFSV